ncbi:hypothetical protein FHS04_000788 [Mesoflavibacter sabulilitoris]|uniref:Lipoprotein n=1 Tax=Mesoflavibacter zeaxanthinifaciens subsp. sabulilitoris TaxID=1520893 RepID=A0A2T1N656_9FLAO|nr:hypothetical protein [Mesoflavibacter zeaxanthinifaciens]MBB3123291.1 hypothetical protein [Mesoflavibacter zeaxanthinifaciens subsp. sabulilitoris]PSG87072.1 hypothetical protein C7H61_13255 [Mesoflavibacter zeaxanthinifaciens subsp. sabulilitoris]
MKAKYLIVSIFSLIVLSIFISCSFSRGTGSVSNDNTLCLNYERSDKSNLEIGLVHEMTTLYQNSTNLDNTKAVRLDLETLKTFIYHLEMESKKNNISSKDLGIRFYYARYPKQATWNSVYARDLSGFIRDSKTEQYALRHTLVLIPTIKQDSINYDFDPLVPQSYTTGLSSSYLTSSDNYNANQTIFALTVTEPTVSAQNHGGLYPPYSNTGTGF